MTDNELLQLAAKAAGLYVKYEVLDHDDNLIGLKVKPEKEASRVTITHWNPLTDDGDALRLAVTLDIQIWRRSGNRVEGIHNGSVLTSPQAEQLMPDPYAATRRAIVRAAAEIGKAMP